MKKLLTCSLLAFALISFNAFSQDAHPLEGGDKAIDQTYHGYLSGDETDATGQPVVIDLNRDAYSRNSIFCDDFNIENTTTIPGWTEQSGDWQIFNYMLKMSGEVDYIWRYITVDGSAQADGCITGRAIYGSLSQVKFVGLVGRYNSLNDWILFKIQDNDNVGYWDSWWLYVNGFEVGKNTLQNYGTDAIIQMEYEGTNVIVKIDSDRDGIWDFTHSTTVSYTATGLCGVAGYVNAFMDDYCCGEECRFDPVSIPLSNIALFVALALMIGFLAFRAYRRF